MNSQVLAVGPRMFAPQHLPKSELVSKKSNKLKLWIGLVFFVVLVVISSVSIALSLNSNANEVENEQSRTPSTSPTPAPSRGSLSAAEIEELVQEARELCVNNPDLLIGSCTSDSNAVMIGCSTVQAFTDAGCLSTPTKTCQ